jgi:ADP-ribosylglycohydrolase
MVESEKLENSLAGCLLGVAVGDAMGLPMEGIGPERQRKLYPALNGHYMLLGKGLVSDDTEHVAMVARTLSAHGFDEGEFAKHLAKELRKWILALPAGVGLATLRSCGKLLMGYGPYGSGVFSAGNGPCMHSPILGVFTGSDPLRMKGLVTISTRITHTDPKALNGAVAIALAAYMSKREALSATEFLDRLTPLLEDDSGEFIGLINQAVSSADSGESAASFAASLGLEKGVTGYIYHTVPVVLQIWLRNRNDYRTAISEAIRLGGDTDTVAAILGGIVGAGVGPGGIPTKWIEDIIDWPLDIEHLMKLAKIMSKAIHDKTPRKPPSLFFPFQLVRNLLFMTLVLAHGARRLAPPY